MHDQDLQDPYVRADQLYQDIINARTFSEIQAAINDVAPVDYEELSKLAATYLCKSLGLPQPADVSGRWSVEELNSILLNHLVDDKGGQHIRNWGTFELKSELCTENVAEYAVSSFHLTKFISAIPCSMWQ